MPAPPVRDGCAFGSTREFASRENTAQNEEGWPSVKTALVQAMQEQFQVFSDVCSAQNFEHLRRFERLGVDLRNHIDASLLASQAPSTPQNLLLKYSSAGRLPPDLAEAQAPAAAQRRKSVCDANRHNHSLASTLQGTLQGAGITAHEAVAQDAESPQEAQECLPPDVPVPDGTAPGGESGAEAKASTSSMKTNAMKLRANSFSAQASSGIKQVQIPGKRINRKGLVKHAEKASRLQAVAENRFFTAGCALLILANSLFIGFEVDTSMHSALQRPPTENPEWFKGVNRFFCVAFSLELMTRIAAFRADFFCSLDYKWNVFDVMMVVSSLVEELMEGMDGTNMSSIRILRVFRLIRTFRIIRVVNIFRSLRLMVCCIFNSLMSLMWALLLLLLTMYLFSIVCVQGASAHLFDLSLEAMTEEQAYSAALGNSLPGSGEALALSSGDDLTDDQLWSHLDLQYRSVIRALMTLLMSISGGVDWYEAVRPLMKISPVYAGLFAAYVVFVLWGVLNVLSAVFVEHALQIRDRDLVVQAEMERTREFMKDMAELFKEADTDGSGILSRDEMEHYLQNERVSMYMATHQLDVSDVSLMFRLLDVDGTDTVEIDEFALGCFRLKGHARCLDVIRMFEVMDTLQSEIASTRTAVNAIIRSMASSANAEARIDAVASREGAGRPSGDAAAGLALEARGPPRGG